MNTHTTPSLEIDSSAIATDIEAQLVVRTDRLRQVHGVLPTLAILSDSYSFPASGDNLTPLEQHAHRLQAVARRLGVAVAIEVGPKSDYLGTRIEWHNHNPNIHGMIVMLPLRRQKEEPDDEYQQRVDSLLSQLTPEKDIDGLSEAALFEPTTAEAAVNLLEGHRPDYRESRIAVRGLGRLVGKPALEILQRRGAQYVTGVDLTMPEDDRQRHLDEADIIITATDVPHSLTPEMFSADTSPKVIIDATTARHPESGKIVGDVSDELRAWGGEHGWGFTRAGNGVGRLAVPTLFSRLIVATETAVEKRAA